MATFDAGRIVFNRVIRDLRSNQPDSMENNMKRLILTLVAGTLLASALGGCVIAPAPGYYYGGGYYHHGYYR
ncbi:hypothetical protein CI15_09460 [Paraburkholderia monticola]|uniref:Uncharacterized protein n=1 Tax=Paraburkholderia monticola TaxID=1399968 RepID=A0A149PW30_9BURK|nr:hypothetical protein CI15_09460 [Paraburkholderia monticola]